MKDREQGSQRFRLQTEASRERDVYRHLQPWISEFRCRALHHNVSSATEDKPTIVAQAEPCPDTALIAFASLVCHRLAARRCFVTLISSSSEYILAEASKSTSLQYGSTNDADTPWLGTCSILREEGMASLAVDGWRRARSGREAPVEEGYYYTEGMSPHWHIISDLRAGEYAQRGVMGHSPRPIRFYASIPLRGATGSVLGSLTIVDDEPRFGVSSDDLTYLEDIADTIVEHLGSVVVRSQRQRSERQIQGLGLFNSGKSSLRQWWLKQEDVRIATAGRHTARRTARQRKEAGVMEFGATSSSSTGESKLPHDENASESDSDSSLDTGVNDPVTSTATTLRNSVADTSRRKHKIATQDFGANLDVPGVPVSKLLLEPSGRVERGRKTANAGKPDGSDFDLEIASRYTYSRASQLMRQAMGADGVVFLNANAVQSRKKDVKAPSLKHESSDTSTHSPMRSTSEYETSEGSTATSEQHCMIEGFSTRDESSLHDVENSYRFDVSESFLATLIKRYSGGKIFNFGSDGTCYSSSGDDNATSGSNSETQRKTVRTPRDGRRLGRVMPGAKTIAFYPLWDEAQDRWASGLFVWSTAPLRYLDNVEDITYLTSWSHSVLAELARLHTIASDTAKSSFISNISHELRTPLHGLLAGVEFLEESELTAFQAEMAHTIQTAGKALLDTVDHILDFSKMSSFTRAVKRRRLGADALQYSQNKAGVDTTEMGVTATVDLALLTEEVIETVVNAYRFRKNENLEVPSVAINIEQRSNWMVKIQPGSWTRILSNLVGNALKYTPAGMITIRLEARGSSPEAAGLERIRLTVQDSGIGMTQNFIRRELYTPFKQANSHSSGTGLGLSIVKRICKDSGADLNITSELGIGTCAKVELQAFFVASTAESSTPSLNVDRFHLFTPEKSTHFAPRSVAPSVMQAAQEWLHCKTTQGPVCEDNSGAVVYCIAEEHLPLWASEVAPKLKHAGRRPSHILVLGLDMRSVTFDLPSQELSFMPVFVHQPIGPQKLLRAIKNDQSSTGMGSSRPISERTSPLEYSITPNSRPFSIDRPPSGHFPWGRVPHVSFDQNSAGPSPSQSASSSAMISSIQPSTLNSATTERSGSIDSTAWHGYIEEGIPRDTVLLVEDNEVNMKLLMALMRKLDYKFLCARNGREAVDTYREHPASVVLVLMDISMPVMDGLTATSKIRETERRRKIPRCHIAALTGVTSEVAQQQAFTSGVDEFYSKPVGMREVKALLEKLQDGNISGS